jgi:hypothetical protein
MKRLSSEILDLDFGPEKVKTRKSPGRITWAFLFIWGLLELFFSQGRGY